MKSKSKVLFYDIEILPQHFDTRFSANRSSICSFGYKWLGEKKEHSIDLLQFPERFRKNPFDEELLVKSAHQIMSQADECIHHYGDKFDFKYMNTKFLKYGLPPIKEVALIDTWKLSKFKLKLSDNRLDTFAEYFDLPRKQGNEVKWWFDTIRGHAPSLKKISTYCRGDVKTLEAVYLKGQELLPAKRRRFEGVLNCPECGTNHVNANRKYTTVSGLEKKVLTCQGCGKSWNMPLSKYLKLIGN